MKNIITVATVNFKAFWGDKELNLSRITEYAEAASKRGADLVLFPETALIGYDTDRDHPEKEDQMQRRLAELIPGPSTEAVSETAKKCGIYIFFGMTERDAEDPGTVYNALAICAPDGSVRSYRKRSLPGEEYLWADPGESENIIDTPWGPIGFGICADFYDFPENSRSCRARGARLFLNSTAMADFNKQGYFSRVTMEAQVVGGSMYIASANLYGTAKEINFLGGSSIVGPGEKSHGLHYYAGHPFDADPEISQQGEMYVATIDLSLTKTSYVSRLWDGEDPNWKAEKQIREYGKAVK